LLKPKLFKSMALISTHGKKERRKRVFRDCLAYLSFLLAGRTFPPTNALTMMPRTLLQTDPKQRMAMNLQMLYPTEWLNQPWKPPAIKTARDGPSDFTTNREWITFRYLERAKKTRLPTAQGLLGQLAAVGTHYVSAERLRTISSYPVPKLILTGTLDNLVRPTNSTYLANILEGSNLVVITGGGHALIGERYEQVNELLLNHFRSAVPYGRQQSKASGVGPATEEFAATADIGRKVKEAGTAADMGARAEQLERQKKSYLPGLLSSFW